MTRTRPTSLELVRKALFAVRTLDAGAETDLARLFLREDADVRGELIRRRDNGLGNRIVVITQVAGNFLGVKSGQYRGAVTRPDLQEPIAKIDEGDRTGLLQTGHVLRTVVP